MGWRPFRYTNMKIKVKCPICQTTKEVELLNEAPVCDNDFMQMIAVSASS